ncbi:hypothetical protein HPB47_024840 [Ixodes persulcatus]|uniref:Uncharacterized protein n=1 Tax=Ixodes persulcatus TaxID=34615 RepID=A0AC60Q3P3_IXOPE|nr:hypothetical protein HPB47_024840 [Ixodes persulcatus]
MAAGGDTRPQLPRPRSAIQPTTIEISNEGSRSDTDEDQVALIVSEKKHPPDKHLRFAATENSEEQVLREADFKDSSEDDQADTLHCHARTPARYSSKIAQRQLIASSLTCLTFMTAEIVGGYLSNSLAIMSDAAHLCADLAGFVISIFAVWIAQKSPTKRMSFGFYRAEILGAMVSVVFIWVLTGILVYTAAQRIYHDDYDIDADIMLIVSGTGVAMNIIMGLILHGWCPVGGSHGHSHGLRSSHGHSHGERSNINIRAALIHVLGDLLQSIGVLIAAYVIKYKPEYKIADPICTFVFSALVLFTTVSILRDAVVILMEGFPKDLAYSTVKAALQSLKGVRMAHSLHVWSLTLDRNALAVHLAVAVSINGWSRPQQLWSRAAGIPKSATDSNSPRASVQQSHSQGSYSSTSCITTGGPCCSLKTACVGCATRSGRCVRPPVRLNL